MWRNLEDEIRVVQGRFDDDVRSWREGYASRGGRIHCGRGCSSCCTLAVSAVFTEARIIAGSLSEARAARVREHARLLLDNSRDCPDLLSWLRMYRAVMGACPLLDEDGSCSIYDIRPLSCRSLISTRESRYCGLDFGSLSREEKAAFIAGLDSAEVSFPMHYAKTPREQAEAIEAEAARTMTDFLGFSLYGSLPFLIWLELEHDLGRVALDGRSAVVDLLLRKRLDNPFLVSLDVDASASCTS
jgi:Fe-S-cluster containining protein